MARCLINKNKKAMEKKYYTPKKEEFKFGFVYEVLINGEWKESILEPCHTAYLQTDLDPENINDIDEAIKKGIVRVKFLDKEDIKSIGFDVVSEVKLESYELVIGDTHFIRTTLKRAYVDEDVIITIFDKQKVIIRRNNTRNMRAYDKCKTYDIFIGIIKNKSELKMIMEMLDVKCA